MKKIATLIVLIFLSIGVSQANIRLLNLNGADVTNNVIVDAVDTTGFNLYDYVLNVVNNNSNQVSINCAVTQNAIVSGSLSYFSWDMCYPPGVSASINPIPVNPFDTIKGYFHAYFDPYLCTGLSIIRYKFTNTTNASDTANITLYLYAGSLGIKNAGIAANNKVGIAFPNPSADATSIRYTVENAGNTQFEMSNEFGQVVFTKHLESNIGTIKLLTSDFSPGVYYYTLRVNGARVASKKLIITQ